MYAESMMAGRLQHIHSKHILDTTSTIILYHIVSYTHTILQTSKQGREPAQHHMYPAASVTTSTSTATASRSLCYAATTDLKNRLLDYTSSHSPLLFSPEEAAEGRRGFRLLLLLLLLLAFARDAPCSEVGPTLLAVVTPSSSVSSSIS